MIKIVFMNNRYSLTIQIFFTHLGIFCVNCNCGHTGLTNVIYRHFKFLAAAVLEVINT